MSPDLQAVLHTMEHLIALGDDPEAFRAGREALLDMIAELTLEDQHALYQIVGDGVETAPMTAAPVGES